MGSVPSAAPTLTFEKFVLSNGLQVIFHRDPKLPVVHVNLWYHVGSKNEKPGKTGFAHLFEHMMFQGSKNVGREYISLMESAGANISQGGVNGTTDFDRTNYFETVPSGSLEMVLWAESDRMGYLLEALTQENLDNQRDVVKNERRQRLDNVPYGRWDELLFENLFPKGHPYSWHVIGHMEDLTAASVDDVKEFFETYYAPNNCTLVLAGDFEPERSRELVEKYFGSLAPSPPLSRPARFLAPLDAERRLVVADRVPQERIYLAWPGVPFFDRDDAALDLLSHLLADGKNSRFYKRLVYDEQAASSVTAFNYSLEIAGIVGAVATARPGVPIERIESMIDEEIRRFSQEGPSDEELQRVKAKQEFEFLSGLERIGGFGGKADRLATYNTYLGSPDHLARDYDRYQSLTAEELRSAAERYLLRPRLVLAFLPERASPPPPSDLDRSLQPAMDTVAAFRPPAVYSDRLANGLALRVVPRHEIPKVVVGLIIRSGVDAEPAATSGLSYLVSEMIDEGTTSRSALEIEAELDRLGSELSTGSSREWSLVSLQSLKRNLGASLDLMADVLLRPSFPDEELERVRKLRLDAILQERANPSSTASRLARKLLFGGDHPYGRNAQGDEAAIRAHAREALERFYRETHLPTNACLIVTGDITADEAKKQAERAFSSWADGNRALPPLEPAAARSRQVYLVDRPGSAQSEIRVSFLAPERKSPDRYVLEVLNNILGGGFTSRLNLNLRETKGYTYGAFSAVGHGRLQGMHLIYTPVQTPATADGLSEILKELEDLGSWRRPVTEKELADARATLTRGYAQRFETLSQVAGEIGVLEGFGLSVEELGRYTAGIESVDEARLESFARAHFKPDQITVVIVGDRKKIEDGLLKLDLGSLMAVDADGEPTVDGKR